MTVTGCGIQILLLFPEKTPLVTFALLAIPANGPLSPIIPVAFDATGLEPGTYTTQRIIHSNDPVRSLVSVPVTMTVLPFVPMLEVTKQAAFLEGVPVRMLVYTLTAANTFSATLGEILLTDTIPLSTTFAWASGSYTRTDSVVAWTAESLAPQDALTATLMVSVEDLPSGLSVVNAAYGARAGEWRVPVQGAPVEAVIPWRCALPLIFKAGPGGDDGG